MSVIVVQNILKEFVNSRITGNMSRHQKLEQQVSTLYRVWGNRIPYDLRLDGPLDREEELERFVECLNLSLIQHLEGH